MSTGKNEFVKLFGSREQRERVLVVRNVFVPVEASDGTAQFKLGEIVFELVILGMEGDKKVMGQLSLVSVRSCSNL